MTLFSSQCLLTLHERERVPQTLATSIASTPITTAPNPYCQQQAPVLHINRVITTSKYYTGRHVAGRFQLGSVLYSWSWIATVCASFCSSPALTYLFQTLISSGTSNEHCFSKVSCICNSRGLYSEWYPKSWSSVCSDDYCTSLNLPHLSLYLSGVKMWCKPVENNTVVAFAWIDPTMT